MSRIGSEMKRAGRGGDRLVWVQPDHDLPVAQSGQARCRHEGAARRPRQQGETLRNKIKAQPATLKRMPSLLRSFFYAPCVAYVVDCCVIGRILSMAESVSAGDRIHRRFIPAC